MNREAILQLADLIEAHPDRLYMGHYISRPNGHPRIGVPFGSLMSDDSTDCGCIAGWALAMTGSEITLDREDYACSLSEEAARILGLSPDQSHWLFLGGDGLGPIRLDSRDADLAVSVLRSLVADVDDKVNNW